MSTGSIHCEAEKIEIEQVGQAIGNLERAKKFLEDIETFKYAEDGIEESPSLIVPHLAGNNTLDLCTDRNLKRLENDWKWIREEFKKKTGLTLNIEYVDSEDCYDEVEGTFFWIPYCELYDTFFTEEHKKLRKLTGNVSPEHVTWTVYG